jgi:aminoglycoside N3'-acetyltransferase
MHTPEVHTIETLIADLARLGVYAGDTVMVHASLRAIGPTEGRADGLIRALDRAVGVRGTLLMVLGARNDWAWVNGLPERERAEGLGGAEPFDALRTPADPEIGTFAELFRTHPGTRVSDHPEGRFAARGHAAAALVAEPPWDDYYGPGSALERLLRRDGKVLRLGANPDSVTLLHHAEYLADVPAKRRARRHRLVRTDRGAEVRVVDCLDDEHGIVDYPDEDYFAAILREFLATDRARTGEVGNATSELIRARDIVPFGIAWMNAHLAQAVR